MSYSVKETKAASQRVKQFDNVSDLLLTVEGRRTIGYNYLVNYNPPTEIDYAKDETKTYNLSTGPNRQQRRG
tara:strand:+ start:1792 stop:2007 length:216 start_codon:yes stop_codon:yes gene_type:complete